MKILIVDKDPEQVQVLTRGFKSLGCTPYGFSSVQQAIAEIRIQGEFIDLLIVDLNPACPEIKELIKQIRLEYPSLLILTMATFVDNDCRNELGDSYYDAFIKKPFTLTVLIETIYQVTKKKLVIYKKEAAYHE